MKVIRDEAGTENIIARGNFGKVRLDWVFFREG